MKNNNNAPETRCEECGNPFPEGKGYDSKFCGSRCSAYSRGLDLE